MVEKIVKKIVKAEREDLEELESEFNEGLVLKMIDENKCIIGSVRAKSKDGTVHIGKLMVHPDHRNNGYGHQLLNEIELYYPQMRYELFTSTRSSSNIRLYQSAGYREYTRKTVNDELQFVYMEKSGNSHPSGQIVFEPIGYVRNDVKDRKDVDWGDESSSIDLDKQYISGMKGLEEFSHAIILYYLDQEKYDKEKHLQRRPQNREDMPLVGIFAQRGKDRPNRIGMTSVRVVSVMDDRLIVNGLDAIDGTPVLDIKPYYPAYDRKEATVPEWVDRLMEHYF